MKPVSYLWIVQALRHRPQDPTYANWTLPSFLIGNPKQVKHLSKNCSLLTGGRISQIRHRLTKQLRLSHNKSATLAERLIPRQAIRQTRMSLTSRHLWCQKGVSLDSFLLFFPFYFAMTICQWAISGYTGRPGSGKDSNLRYCCVLSWWKTRENCWLAVGRLTPSFEQAGFLISFIPTRMYVYS